MSAPPIPTRPLVVDLAILALIERGGYYESPTDTAGRDLLGMSWPNPPAGASNPLRTGLKRLGAAGIIQITYGEPVETDSGSGRSYRRMRAIRYVGASAAAESVCTPAEVGVISCIELARLIEVRSDFLLKLGPGDIPDGLTPWLEGIFAQIMRYVQDLRARLRELEAGRDTQVTEREADIRKLRRRVQDLEADLYAATTDPSVLLAHAFAGSFAARA